MPLASSHLNHRRVSRLGYSVQHSTQIDSRGNPSACSVSICVCRPPGLGYGNTGHCLLRTPGWQPRPWQTYVGYLLKSFCACEQLTAQARAMHDCCKMLLRADHTMPGTQRQTHLRVICCRVALGTKAGEEYATNHAQLR